MPQITIRKMQQNQKKKWQMGAAKARQLWDEWNIELNELQLASCLFVFRLQLFSHQVGYMCW